MINDVGMDQDNLTLFDNATTPAGPTMHPTFNVEPNTAFKSFILQFCTFWIAYYLRIFRNGKALGRTVRCDVLTMCCV